MQISLSPYGVKDAINKIEFLKDQINVASEDIVSELVDKGSSMAAILNSSAPQSGTTKSTVVGKVTESGRKGYVALTGESAVYDEFGTGEEGASDPHPDKSRFALNPYNSGPSIFYNQFANRYQWRYYPMHGKPYYTETGLTSGIPSGKQMYNTAKYLKEIKQELVSKKLNDAIRIFK